MARRMMIRVDLDHAIFDFFWGDMLLGLGGDSSEQEQGEHHPRVLLLGQFGKD